MIKTVTVSDKGQIAIPKSFREILGISKGDELVLVQSGQRLLIEKAPKVERVVEDDFSDMLKLSEDSLKEIWDNKEDDIWAEYLK